MPAHIPTAWTGSKVRIRSVEPGDWESFQRWDQDTEAQRLGWHIQPPRSEQLTRKFAEETAAADPESHNRRFMVETLDGEPVGTLNVHGAEPREGTFEYGISIAREHWRKGFASEAITIVLRYYFDELRYQKVLAVVYDFNQPSQALHHSLGFVEEGRLRRAHYTNGKHHDSLLFGMTDDEFRARHPAS